MSAPTNVTGTLPGTNPILFSAIKAAIDPLTPAGSTPLGRIGAMSWLSPSATQSASLSISYMKSKPIWFSYTPCGATYRYGPTDFASAPSAYARLTGTNASITMTSINGTSGIQRWVVPRSGKYYFVAAGAAGAGASVNGGRGAIVWNLSTLSQGDRIYILVGQKGELNTTDGFSGGGGGTFVLRFKSGVEETVASNRMLSSSYDKILIAGGGGGKGTSAYLGYYEGVDAAVTTSGTKARDGTGTGGTNGSGGIGGTVAGTGGSGAGWSGDGTTMESGVLAAVSVLNGAAGGYWGNNNKCRGGYGGGGVGWNGGPGGGGYSGGAGVTNSNMRTGGGGGGSYDWNGSGNDATRYTNLTSGYNENTGFVYVSWYGP